MNTKPTVSRYADRDKVTIQPNTDAKAKEEKADYNFSVISRGHFACDSTKATHIIIDKDGKIGCSCGDMTYRCTNNAVCKHIAIYLDLNVPPQTPAPGELINKLMLMGWVGGKDNLHPAELLKPVQNESGKEVKDATPSDTVHYVCPKCGDVVDTEAGKLREWKLNHMDVCAGNKAHNRPQSHPPDPLHEPEDPEYPEHAIPEHPDPPNEDYSNCQEFKTSSPSKPAPPDNVPPNLAAALCNMQKVDLLALTDSDNPFHNAKYADLASVWAAIRKPLTDNGLAVIQTTEHYPEGITVVTTLLHTSGETFTARLSCEVPKSKPDKNGQVKPNIQGLGSTITYLRRYSLAAMVGVAPVDDDGEAAMSRGG